MQGTAGCACIRGVYDFRLESFSNKAFLYQDLSDWMEEYDKPETYFVTLSVPGSTNSVNLEMYTQGVNVIKPFEIGLTGKDGIDGVYCFTTKSCGVTYTKARAITYTLDCKLDHMIAQGIRNPAQLKEAREVGDYIKAIHYNAERNFVDEAKFFYKLASDRLICKNCQC